MPIQVDWYDKSKNIMLMVFEGNWTLDELYDAMQQQTEMAQSVGHKVDSITDFSSAGDMPPNILSHFPSIASKIPTQMDRTVMVGVNNRFLQTTSGIFSRIYRKLEMKQDVSEAVSYLMETHTEA